MKTKSFPAFYFLSQLTKCGRVPIKPTLPPASNPQIHVSSDVFSEITGGCKPEDHPDGVEITLGESSPDFWKYITQGTMSAAATEVVMDSARVFHLLGTQGPAAVVKEAKDFMRSQQAKDTKEILSIVRSIHYKVVGTHETPRNSMKGKADKATAEPGKNGGNGKAKGKAGRSGSKNGQGGDGEGTA